MSETKVTVLVAVGTLLQMASFQGVTLQDKFLGLAAATALLIWVGWRYAGGKGYHGAWGLLGSIGIIGFVILYLFPKKGRLNREAVVPTKPAPARNIHAKCPQCSAPYNPTDYQVDAQAIYCSECKAELPRTPAS